MTRATFPAAALLAALFTAAGASAQAQQGPVPGIAQPARPAVSPYLNLLRQGNSAGVNYYGLVRPQTEFRSAIQNLQQQTSANRAGITVLADASLPATGHGTAFLNTGGYFGVGVRPGASIRPSSTAATPRSASTRAR